MAMNYAPQFKDYLSSTLCSQMHLLCLPEFSAMEDLSHITSITILSKRIVKPDGLYLTRFSVYHIT